MIDFDKAGGMFAPVALVSDYCVVQMIAWMNREALAKTVDTGEAHYWSRSRGKPARLEKIDEFTLRIAFDDHPIEPGRIEEARLLFARPWQFLLGVVKPDGFPPTSGIEVAQSIQVGDTMTSVSVSEA